MQKRAFKNPKLEIVWSHVLEEVLGDDENGVTGVRLKSTKGEGERQLEAAGMFLAIGHTPNTAFLKGKVDMDDKGYIRWTAPFRTYTSVEGLFAAGDVADDYYRQAITSAGTGCMAALDAERYLAEKESVAV
jgi:thioredoxin reductase (NADPH)